MYARSLQLLPDREVREVFSSIFMWVGGFDEPLARRKSLDPPMDVLLLAVRELVMHEVVQDLATRSRSRRDVNERRIEQ